MISLHPTHQQLVDFVEGNASAATALVISAHVDMCPHCQSIVGAIQEELTEKAFQASSMSSEFDRMFADIIQLPEAEKAIPSPVVDSITLDGLEFKLPRTLRRYVKNTGDWSHLLGKLWQAPVDLGPIGKANFIYMEKGGKVPEHTHKGTELTLVIDGEFSDGLGCYDSGDFMLLDSNHVHTPHSESPEGCLVFTVVDQPLHFTSGIARLLNPFSHLFFK